MRRLYTLLLALAALALVLLIASVIILQTGWFKNKVRQRIISEVESTTGGRVEIGQFNYNWHNFTAEVAPFVLHGTEPAGAPPLFRSSKIHVGLEIISFVERTANIAALTIDRPEIHVTVNADGTTNVPTPRAVTPGDIVAEILNLKIQHFTLANGFAEYNSQRIPLDLHADHLSANLRYFATPARYEGELDSHQVHVSMGSIRDVAFDLTTKLAIENNQVLIRSATLTQNRSTVQLAGTISDLSSPHGQADLSARLFLADLTKFVRLPIESRGEVAFTGKAVVEFVPLRYAFDGRINGRDLAYESKPLQLRNIALSSRILISPAAIKLPDIDLAALSGHFRGSATIEELKRFRLTGNIQGFSARQLAAFQGQPAAELNGTVTGPIEAEGLIVNNGFADLKARAMLQVTPGDTGVPIAGSIEATYDQRAGIVQLGNSNLTLGTTVVTTAGTLGQTLTIHLTSSNLHDLLLALPLMGETAPRHLPLQLVRGGTARFDGTIAGPLQNPALSGRLQLTSFEAEKQNFSRLDATLDATKSDLNVRTLALDGDPGHVTGSGRLGLVNWWPADASRVHAVVQVSRPVSAFRDFPITSALKATATIAGTYGSPQATAHINLQNVTAYDQPFDRAAADVSYRDNTIDVANGSARSGKAEATFSAKYNYSGTDWTSGHARFNFSSRAVPLAQIKAVTDRRKGLDGQLDIQGSGAAHFIKGDFQLDDLDSQMALHNAAVDGRPIGNLEATAKTRGQILEVRASADLRGTKVRGQGEWRLAGDYPGNGEITVPRLTFATLKDLIPADTGRDLPFGGFLSATVKVSGPLKNRDAMKADVTIPELQINASANTQPRAGAQPADLVLRASRPLQFEVTSKGVDIRSAQFVGTDTTVQAAGRVAFTEKEPWTVRLNGSINLAILQLFNYDLLASGVATLNATVRGSVSQPELNGRLELKNASLFLSDLPNGVEKANGVIVFDRNRASVEKLSGESGGGSVTFQPGGFVGFSGGLLIYRIQAAAEHVRYRDPEGYSITANASLSLAGTSARSTLSGTVTVIRAAFLPQTDVGSLLASTAKPISVPTTPNAYVRGIQFDVRIDAAQNLEVVTSLTHDIQAEANLRFRGNVERPILIGNIAVTQGVIDFFGNKYTLNRGEINFFNPAKIEPVVDMDLETHVRGITVDVRFNGPLEKLNFSYRSDPPLESNQIIALLAVGREPIGLGALASSQATTNTSYLSTGGNALLAQAVTAPVSGRLQRFFGVSHIKIDPQLTDITSVPQARLTLEQQISKDITLTYITNLSRTSEQIVRVEWNVSRRWSVVAVRDENGLFGVDIQYRKAFR
jgi:translocation and assembly module TamB